MTPPPNVIAKQQQADTNALPLSFGFACFVKLCHSVCPTLCSLHCHLVIKPSLLDAKAQPLLQSSSDWLALGALLLLHHCRS